MKLKLKRFFKMVIVGHSASYTPGTRVTTPSKPIYGIASSCESYKIILIAKL